MCKWNACYGILSMVPHTTKLSSGHIFYLTTKFSYELLLYFVYTRECSSSTLCKFYHIIMAFFISIQINNTSSKVEIAMATLFKSIKTQKASHDVTNNSNKTFCGKKTRGTLSIFTTIPLYYFCIFHKIITN